MAINPAPILGHADSYNLYYLTLGYLLKVKDDKICISTLNFETTDDFCSFLYELFQSTSFNFMIILIKLRNMTHSVLLLTLCINPIT